MSKQTQETTKISRGPRAVALIGPYGSGKTSLMESIAFLTGAVPRKGSVPAGTSLGDSGPEARARQMSVEANVLATQYLGEEFTFIDCPGSIEFLADTLNVLPAVDAAVVVCEPEAAKAQMLQPFLKRLSDANIPHILFVNKFDKAKGSLRGLLNTLQAMSEKPLLLRQIPIWENGAATGFVDLALERAYVYRAHAPSEVVSIADFAREKEARFQMLERLADYDERLMEELLSDVEPPREEVFQDLARELSEGLVVPVLIGSAENDNGVDRLLKALRHEVPGVAAAAQRLGLKPGADTVVQVMKTFHSGHGGKLSLVRVLRGSLKEGAVLHGADGHEARIGGILALSGEKQAKRNAASEGDTVALARLEHFRTGEMLSTGKTGAGHPAIEAPPPVYRMAIAAEDRKDEVKVTAAIAKLIEEDPSLVFEQNAETQEMMLAGQGEIHLKVAVELSGRNYDPEEATRAARGPDGK